MDQTLDPDILALVRGDHPDPFGFLGMHEDEGGLAVRAFLPQARSVAVVSSETSRTVRRLSRLHSDGFFAARLRRRRCFSYRLRLAVGEDLIEIEDPYRFPLVLGDMDVYLLAEGSHVLTYDKLGAHPRQMEGVPGTSFAVWAPNASRVSVVGSFNEWDGRRHPMRLRPECGVWEIFLPGVSAGDLYKYEIKTRSGAILTKSDPYAFRSERPPATASIVCDAVSTRRPPKEHDVRRAERNAPGAPISIYEVHLGSWRRRPEEDDRYLTYRELADLLPGYVAEMGFTHVEFMPVAEYPFDGSWGYQPVGLFAPTSRYGSPDDFAALVERCHAEGLGVLLDWVPGHFPDDPHGLARFDGTHLYEHEDPRKGKHMDWDTLIYNYSRREVANFLQSAARYWVDRFGVDGLRVDAVASMLYLDYSRRPGEWEPNRYGGNENLEAVAFLRQLNRMMRADGGGAIMVAEESTAWPGVSKPVEEGGLGFDYKWNLGWMHDTLSYMSRDPVHRRHHQDQLTFGLLYAFSERFILPLSHDEVVHGKGSLLGKMPGDAWQKFANLRLYFAFLYTQPGKKLLFMGGEFAQEQEWNHDRSLDWHLLDDPRHRGVSNLVRDLNALYRGIPALHERDCEPEGFEWIDASHRENSIVSYVRRGRDPDSFALVVCNFTPVVRRDYRVGTPAEGTYRECLNTDSPDYGGSGTASGAPARAVRHPWHGRPFSIALTLPPLAALILEPESGRKST